VQNVAQRIGLFPAVLAQAILWLLAILFNSLVFNVTPLRHAAGKNDRRLPFGWIAIGLAILLNCIVFQSMRDLWDHNLIEPNPIVRDVLAFLGLGIGVFMISVLINAHELPSNLLDLFKEHAAVRYAEAEHQKVRALLEHTTATLVIIAEQTRVGVPLDDKTHAMVQRYSRGLEDHINKLNYDLLMMLRKRDFVMPSKPTKVIPPR
jgi:hypothetical protein